MQPKYPHIRVRLTGQDGNAFYVLGKVQEAMRRGKVTADEVKKFVDEATSVDYDHLLQVCMQWVEVS